MAKKISSAVSVIVPMFNAARYIGETLTSLANQTFQDFEIIIVDDCSTDDSVAVVENFSATFGGRLRLKKLPRNSGCAGIPRNVALEAARGKYVYFLDSDDLLTEIALADLHAAAEKFSADVVHAERYFEFFGGDKISEPRSFQTGAFVTEPTLETFDTGERVAAFIKKRFLWWGCNKLLRRQLLVDNKITFTATKGFEDFAFSFKCLVAAQNYLRVPFVSYLYRIRDDSMSHRISYGADLMSDIIGVVKSLNDFMRGKKFFVDNPQYRYAVTDFFMQERLEVFAEEIFLTEGNDIGTVYDFLQREIFSRKHQDSVALTSYLFTAASILKLYTKQQAVQIDELRRQLAALKK